MGVPSKLSLPEFNTLYEGEVYTLDFLTTPYVNLANPDPGLLRRGFLVLGRYKEPALQDIAVYLQQAAYQPARGNNLDARVSQLVSALPKEYQIDLRKGDLTKLNSAVKSINPLQKKDSHELLEVDYFIMPAPLCVSQRKSMKDHEWYHTVSSDDKLKKKGLQQWFLIRKDYNFLSKPEEVKKAVDSSSAGDKEGTIYVMKNICKVFSPSENFARLNDLSDLKIKQVALDILMRSEQERSMRDTLSGQMIYTPAKNKGSN
ncbi:MAG: hypothetical protein AABX05_03055 [Nanoarchaeota archaeon]